MICELGARSKGRGVTIRVAVNEGQTGRLSRCIYLPHRPPAGWDIIDFIPVVAVVLLVAFLKCELDSPKPPRI